jgi:hypothetical protein
VAQSELKCEKNLHLFYFLEISINLEFSKKHGNFSKNKIMAP